MRMFLFKKNCSIIIELESLDELEAQPLRKQGKVIDISDILVEFFFMIKVMLHMVRQIFDLVYF